MIATQFVFVDSPVRAASTPPIQVFYLKMPEDLVLNSYKKIYTGSAGPMHSVTGISITANNTLIYYDQWENGFDVDLSNPANLRTPTNLGGTQIWGDSNPANGCAPNVDGRTAQACTIATDVLNAGNVIVLENDVAIPRNNSTILFDGRDKIGSTKVVAITRSVWAATPGTVLTDAIEVYDTTRWGTSYTIPVGENTSSALMFSYVSILVVASQNGTTVTIDKDGNGTLDITQIMNQGDVYQVDGGVSTNAAVHADKPVQVDLITGKAGSIYACRWFQVPPQHQWTSSLWTAVGTTSISYPASVFLFNPGASALTVNYDTKAGTGSVSVPAKGNTRVEMPQYSGAHFYASSNFLAFGTMDSSATGTNSTYDWGYTLVADIWLTTAFVAGWAPGTGANPPTTNGSPVWVTAIKPTTIYVDYGDPAPAAPNTAPNGKKYDISFPVGQYESRQIYGVNNTQTGMKVFTADGTSITGAWGEDPSKAGAGTPYLDAGYTIPPLPEVLINKQAAVASGGDVNGNGRIDPGDTILYTLTVRNNGAVAAFNTMVSEPSIATHTTYVSNSTTLDGVPVADNAGTLPLIAGINIPLLSVGSSASISYKLAAIQFPPIYATITNTAHALVNGEDVTVTINTPVNSNASQCAVNFTNAGGAVVQAAYQLTDLLYVRINDSDTTNLGPLLVSVMNSGPDREALSLAETGAGTGVFVNSSGLPLSTTDGLSPDDGSLNVEPGDTLTVSYTDPVYGDTCSASTAIAVPTKTKALYLSDPSQALDRIDPLATSDGSTVTSTDMNSASSSATVTTGTTTGYSSSSAASSF